MSYPSSSLESSFLTLFTKSYRTRVPQMPSRCGWRRTEWYEIRHVAPQREEVGIDRGEGEAIALAKTLGVPLLIDDKRGREFAVEQGLMVIGTLGVIDRAARIGLLDYTETIRMLDTTSFHLSKDHVNALIKRFMDDVELQQAKGLPATAPTYDEPN